MSEEERSDRPQEPNVPDVSETASRKRTPFEAEALVGFAAAVGVGVFAVPFDVSRPIRYLIAAIAFVLVLAVFGRYPHLSRWLVATAIRFGFPLLGVLIIVLCIVLAKPSLRPSVGAIRILTAGAAAFAFRLIDIITMLGLQWRTMTKRFTPWSVVAVLSMVEFGFGALGCALVRSARGGVAFTQSLVWSAIVGIATICIYRSVLEVALRQLRPHVDEAYWRSKDPYQRG